MFKWTFYKEIFLKIHSKTHNMHVLIMKFKSSSGKKKWSNEACNKQFDAFLPTPTECRFIILIKYACFI